MKILIIDDETISRKVLLRQMEGIGECTAVDSSTKGLELFISAMTEKKPFDLITMDVSMPVMDGLHLLQQMRKKESELKIKKADRVKIIMVTSRMNLSTIRSCIALGCDGYLSKPVNRFQLIGSLGKIGFKEITGIKAEKSAKIDMVAQVIKRFYEGKIHLPGLPRIAADVRAAMDQPDTSMEDLSKIIEKDILMASKLISISNSPMYRGMDQVNTLSKALVRIGMKACAGVVFTIATKKMYVSDNPVVSEMFAKLWLHSFACACFARRLGEITNHSNPETLFLMGIVHDIGKMLLIKAISEIYPDESFESDTRIAIHEIHTTFGAALLKKMRFSKEFVQIAEFHHWNEFSEDDDMDIILINLSDELAGIIGYDFYQDDTSEQSDDDIEKQFEAKSDKDYLIDKGISAALLSKLIDEMDPIIKESVNIF